MKLFTFYIDPGLLKKVKEIAKQDSRSTGAMIRIMIGDADESVHENPISKYNDSDLIVPK